MNTKNTPAEDQEARNIQKEKGKKNVYGLLKDGVEREFGNPMDPRKFDAFKKNKETNRDNIRTHMRDLRVEDIEQWGDVDDAIIDQEASDANITEQIIRMGQKLIFNRKRVYDRAIELFPSLGKADRNTLRGEIEDYNADELHNFITRNSAMRNMVYGVFPGLRGVSPSEHKDFDRIFDDKDQYFTEKDLARLEKIFHNYYRFDQVPDKEDLAFILSGYSPSAVSDTRRKEILTALGVTLSIKDAYDFGLIDDSFLENLSKTWFEEAYNTLPESSKKSFIRGLSKNDSYVISASDFSENSLGEIFSDKKDSLKIADEIFRSLALDMPEKDKTKTTTIAEKIREKKRKEEEVSGEEDYDLYEEVIEELKLSLASSPKGTNIENIDNLKREGAVVQFKHPSGSIQYVRVLKTQNPDKSPYEINNGTEYGVRLEGLNVTNGRLGAPKPFDASYDTFMSFLQDTKEARVLTAEEFGSRLTKNMSEVEDGSDKIFDAHTVESEPVNASNIASKLDLIDEKGSKYGFEKGTAFIAPIHDAKGKRQSEDGIWTIKATHPGTNTIDLIDPWGNNSENGLPIEGVYAVIMENSTNFKRVAKVKDDTDMIKGLNDFGVDNMKDGKLLIKTKDSHGHEIEKEVTCFEDEEKGHIRIESAGGGIVRFGEYGDTDILKAQEYAKKNGIDKKVQGLYSWRQMSYPAFLQYLESKKLKASSEDKIVKDASHDLHGDGHGHHPHVHGSFMSRIFQMQNPASIWKGFEMMFHGIEHTLEKGAKLDAAKFALSTSKFLHLPDTVSAQIYADVVEGSKEIVEKYEKKIFGLPGPRGRIKCMHIVENHDSRPEEIMGAMNYMLKSYGNLYGENMKHKQTYVKDKEHCITAPKGTFMFFDAFVISSRIGNLSEWRKKAYERAIGEMGSAEEHEGEPTEELLVHTLFKMLDGNWEDYPYAASVMKAIGGPSGFEKMWKFEGYKNAKEKGKEQTQMVNAQGRLNKAISYLETHEIYKGIGAMERVVGKVKDPEFQAFPFVWAVGGFSRYASHAALQDIKGYAEQAYSFHAYAFMRKPQDNTTYKKVVRLALQEKGGAGLVKKFDDICKKLERNPDNPDHTKGAAAAMMKLWQENCKGDDGIHNMLQGHNGWLIKKAREGNGDVRNYIGLLNGAHKMQLDSPTVSGDLSTDFYNEWGYRSNRIFTFNEDTGLLSLRRTMNKINLRGTKTGDREMTDDDYNKLWGGVMDQMNQIKDPQSFNNDIDLQKKQFMAFRKEIIDTYITKLNARTPQQSSEVINQLLALPHKYWMDIAKMGIDPHAIFDPDIEKNSLEDDYARWKENRPYEFGKNIGGGHALDITSYVQNTTSQVTATANTGEQDSYRVRQMIPKTQQSFDADANQPGGAAYMGPEDEL